MFKQLARFSILLVIILSGVFALHQFILSCYRLPKFGDSLILSYCLNAFMAIVIITSILLLKNRFKSQLGFIFMFGSFFKFIIFFIVFQPIYKADSLITRPEFIAFFLPYAICLIVEVIYLSKWLNQLR